MQKQIFHIVLLLFCTCELFSQEKIPYNVNEKKVNWGFKIGFNAAIPDATVYTEDGPIASRAINKVGYLAEGFARFNFKRVFLQPEISYNITRENVYFLGTAAMVNPAQTLVDINVNAFDISAIIGYNSVKQNEFGLSIFSGAKYKYAYQIGVEPSNGKKITDTDLFYNLYLTAGLGVNISHLFFDFRYDVALFKNQTELPYSPTSHYEKISINKIANILSFSVGFMF